ncbi:hypothetical protein [Shewanella dokdonensis]|uniref:Uncharacterized protein n=1 Tax=Shewanella dokdonensis TaxID=712036 RepID=A0ABX8DFR7_9GAMM|nr:hypothetical protein [Shewanella dokdonensis]MCL1073011.1 hypothetical protein [Shewanella dokdonensis]QVK23076.1 hypothetical protein KHX94_18570 [Shewanella dokdonensis]
MPIDWDTFSDEVKQAIDDSVIETNDKLASQLSSLTSLKDAEVKALFPDTTDLKSCVDLMKIVNDATSEQDKINRIVNGSEAFAKAALRLLQKLL